MLKIDSNSSAHIFTCKLEQITPMLHFQPDQEGATLRATQVKPMLDRFLRKKCVENNIEIDEEMLKEWFMVKKNAKKEDCDKAGFRYKLTIKPTTSAKPRMSNEWARLVLDVYLKERNHNTRSWIMEEIRKHISPASYCNVNDILGQLDMILSIFDERPNAATKELLYRATAILLRKDITAEQFNAVSRVLRQLNNDHNVNLRNLKGSLDQIETVLYMPNSYFGNMPVGNTANDKMDWIKEYRKEAVLFADPLAVEIFCKNDKLRELIVESLQEFFLLHSFGTRTSKGFGSFIISETTNKKAKDIFNSRYNSYIYVETAVSPRNHTAAMTYAAGIMQLMKSGINQSSRIDSGRGRKVSMGQGYCKGYLIKYFLNKNIGSDKRFIKSSRIPNIPRGGQFDVDSPHSKVSEPTPVNGHRFIRALLGLAELIEFRDNMFNDTVKMISTDGSVQRFRCPVTVRILPGGIYFLPEDHMEGILGKSFIFLNKEESAQFLRKNDKEKQEYIDQNENRVLSVPKSFNLKEFLYSFADEYNNTTKEEIRGYNGQSFKNITSFGNHPQIRKGGPTQ